MQRGNKIKFKHKKGRLNPKVRKPELTFLYPTHHLALFYTSTKHHQNIPNGIHVTERTQNQIQTRRGGNYNRKPKLSFLYVTYHLILFYISTKYHKNIPKSIRLKIKSIRHKINAYSLSNITKRDNAKK